MKKTVNKENIEGRVYSHNLALKTVQNTASANYGKEFINGTLDVATDDACLNVLTVNFTYVTETTKSGGKNATYTALKQIIDTGKTVVVDGMDAATKVKVSTSLIVNDFYSNRKGEEELVSAKRNDGGFVSIVNTLNADEHQRNAFTIDMLINGTRLVEANEERNIPADYLEVKGAVFNFRNEMQPVTMVCKNPVGIAYFESLDASSSNPVFTQVMGSIINEQTVITREEETAFGEPRVQSYTRSRKEWVIESAKKEPYEIGEDVTVEEIKEMIANRNTYLAGVKQRQEEYQASKAAPKPAATAPGAYAAAGGFNF